MSQSEVAARFFGKSSCDMSYTLECSRQQGWLSLRRRSWLKDDIGCRAVKLRPWPFWLAAHPPALLTLPVPRRGATPAHLDSNYRTAQQCPSHIAARQVYWTLGRCHRRMGSRLE